MNRPTFILALAACLCAGAAHAQSPAGTPVAQPSTPAPHVASTLAAGATAPVVVQTQDSANAASSGVTQIVYTPQLPTADELTNAAAAQGLTVERLVQTSTQVIAFYRNASGQVINVAYQSLPPTGTAPTAPAPAPASAVVVTSPPPPTVVYQTAPRVVYYDYPEYYYPRAWYPPVSFNFGFGYHRSFHHGGFRHHHHHHRR